MITRPTTLILGAGASIEFGFPSGRELLNMLVVALDPGVAGGELINALLALDFSRGDINQFQRALAGSGAESVDAFLEYRQDLVEVGKAAIAAALIAFEQPQSIRDYNRPSWYRYLFRQMVTEWNRWSENHLTILTFNYDRSLDFFLASALSQHFRRPVNEVREKMAVTPIIHLHGDLGSIWPSEQDHRPYERDLSDRNVDIARRRIRIIHENADVDPVFQRARDALRRSERVCFLGFGFHPTNVQRLQPMQCAGQFYATAYDMTGPEVTATAALLPRLNAWRSSLVLPFLREEGVLL